MPTSDTRTEQQVNSLLRKLTLAEKVSLLSGKDSWQTVPIQRLGIPALIMTDGPNAVCAWSKCTGQFRPASTCFPTGIGLAATWNPALLRRVGVALGRETLGHGYDILLGPCVNIVRAPLAGRNFETYGEDPFLSGRLGAAYVQGVQSTGAGTSLKHYACNNQEFNRMNGSSVLDERTLREIYLPHFEHVVKASQPWTVMCAYNRINGIYASEHRQLLTRILRREWGFRGIVVSDWGANHTIVESIRGGLDIEMPGPAKYYGNLLVDAVHNWQIEEDDVDAAVRRILRLLIRSGRMNGRKRPQGVVNPPAHQALARRVAEESITLLKNNGAILPVDLKAVRSIAVIGPNAAQTQTSGGGSAEANPPYRVHALAALKKHIGRRAVVRYEKGCENIDDVPHMSAAWCVDKRGFRVQYFNHPSCRGKPASERYDGWHLSHRSPLDRPPKGITAPVYSVRWTAAIRVPETCRYRVKLDTTGSAQIRIDGRTLLRRHGTFAEIDLDKGRRHEIRVELTTRPGADMHKLFVSFGPSPDYRVHERIARAADAARRSDIALVFVGYPRQYESEGHDRPHMKLTNRQDELVRAVVQANPKTVVLVNAGAPVAMPWADTIPALVWLHYPGQEAGNAIARILLGQVNPSGKLPITLPKTLSDNPTHGNYPGNREVRYGEGLSVGYRWYDKKEVVPLFPFGHGLSYTSFRFGRLQVPRAFRRGESVRVSLNVTNTGSRSGCETVQLYVADPRASVDRPVKELKGFLKMALRPGQTRRAVFTLDERAFSFFHPDRKQWTAEPGVFQILAGSSSGDIRSRATTRLTGD